MCIRDRYKDNADLSVFPNPCCIENTATIYYDIPETGPVDISIYTVSGIKVATILHRTEPADRKFVEFVPAAYGITEGMYIVKYVTFEKQETFSIIIKR